MTENKELGWGSNASTMLSVHQAGQQEMKGYRDKGIKQQSLIRAGHCI